MRVSPALARRLNPPLPLDDPESIFYERLGRLPISRFMGSKHAILPFLHGHLRELEFGTVLDAFSGSGSVSYLLKAMGKSVTSNDFLAFCHHTAYSFVANSETRLSQATVLRILQPHPAPDHFIEDTFRGLYFTEDENRFLDNATAHIREMTHRAERSIAFAALVRACLRRRPRGIFTYTGVRYQDGRRDLQISMQQQFVEAVEIINAAIFDNGQFCDAMHNDVFALPEHHHYDLVYLDPPYLSPHSDNDYSRRYHFVEGLTRYWEGLNIQHHTTTRKFERIRSAFDTSKTIHSAFRRLFDRYQDSTIVVSHSSNCIPSRDEMEAMLREFKGDVTVREKEHRYSFGTHGHKVESNRNEVTEFLFVGTGRPSRSINSSSAVSTAANGTMDS